MDDVSPEPPIVRSVVEKCRNELEDIRKSTIKTIDVINNGFSLMKQKKALDRVGTEIMESFEAQKQKTFRSTTIVALIGESGVGKSTLTNALLGYDNLAPTSGIRACTTVVTEFSELPKDAEFRFVGEVEYISLKDYQDDLTMSIADIRDWINSNEDENREVNQPSNGKKHRVEKNTELDDAKDVAEAKIYALFPDFTHAQLDNLPDMLHHLYKNELLREGKQKIKTNDEKDFIVTLGNLTSDNGTKDNKILSYWPLVKCVRIYVDAEILRTGVVLVDLPGVRDSNAARAAIAKDYMVKADEIIIVSPLNRILSNKTVETLADGYVRQLAFDLRKKVVIVCTKCEMYDIDDALKDYPNDEELVIDNNAINKEIMILSTQIENEEDEDELVRLVDRVEELENDQDKLPLRARDRNVPQLVQNKFKALLGDEFTVDTFLVASKVYKELNSTSKRRSKGKRKGRVNQAMTIEETQVPKLRLYCAKIPLMRELHFTTHFTTQVIHCLTTVDVWLLESPKLSETVRADMNNDIEIAKTILANTLQRSKINLAENISREFAKIETAAISAARLSKKAAIKKEQKLFQTIRWNTYKAHCRYNGEWSSSNNLNEMFLECFDVEIGKVWRSTMERTQKLCVDYYTDWHTQILSFEQTWCMSACGHLKMSKDTEDHILVALGSLVKIVKSRLHEDKARLIDFLEVQQSHLREPFRCTDMLKEHFKTTYSAATAETGKGCYRRMSDTLSESLATSQPIFDKIRDETIARLTQGNQDLVSQFMNGANTSIDDLWRYYKLWSDENIALSEEEEQGRVKMRKIKTEVEKEMEKLNMKLQALETKVKTL